MQRCVDEQSHVVDDKFCKNLPLNGQQPAVGVTVAGWGSFRIATTMEAVAAMGLGRRSMVGVRPQWLGTVIRQGPRGAALGVRMAAAAKVLVAEGRVMERVSLIPRANWQAKVEAQGLTFHSPCDGAADVLG